MAFFRRGLGDGEVVEETSSQVISNSPIDVPIVTDPDLAKQQAMAAAANLRDQIYDSNKGLMSLPFIGPLLWFGGIYYFLIRRR